MLKTRYVNSIMDTLSDDEVVFAKKLIEHPDSIEAKREYEKWIRKFGGGIPEIAEFISRLKVEDEAKDDLIADILSAKLLYGVSPLEYFQFEFQKKSDKGRNEYFTDAEKFIAFRSAYDFSKYELVRNKWNQYNILGDLFSRDCVLCMEGSESSTKEKFAEFVSKHPVFVFKPLRAAWGNGVRIIDSKKCNLTCEKLFAELSKAVGIADQKIEQDERMGCLHPESVNTIRLIGVRDRTNRKSYYIQSVMRMGKGNAIVDNFNGGGICARVETKNGIVYTLGADGGGKFFVNHPDTGVQIVGFRVPEWNELIEIAAEALCRMEQYARYIGFDFALSVDGWKIVEINPFPQIDGQQMTTRKGSREEMIALAEKCR